MTIIRFKPEIQKIMQLSVKKIQSQLLIVSSNMWVALKRASFQCWDEDADLEMDRPLLQILKVATTGSHAGSQGLGEVCHHLVDVAALPRRSANQLSTHQSSWSSAAVYSTFPARCPGHESPVGSNLESLGATHSLFFSIIATHILPERTTFETWKLETHIPR